MIVNLAHTRLYQNDSLSETYFVILGPVVQRWVSANSELKIFNPWFEFTYLKIDFGCYFRFTWLGFLGKFFNNNLEIPAKFLDEGIMFKASPNR